LIDCRSAWPKYAAVVISVFCRVGIGAYFTHFLVSWFAEKALVNASITVYAWGKQTQLGQTITDNNGHYSLPVLRSQTAYYLVSSGGSINGQVFNGSLTTVCLPEKPEECHLTPYSSLLAALAPQFSGVAAQQLSSAQAQITQILAVHQDPFIQELLEGSASGIDLNQFRQQINLGSELASWLEQIIFDINDGYLDNVSLKPLFPQALARPVQTVSKQTITLDQVNTPIAQSADQAITDSLMLPENSQITYQFVSLSTGEEGESVNSESYLADIVYIETQDLSAVTGNPDAIQQRVIYQSFNVGSWQGKLNAETTLLSRIFMSEPALLFLPNAEKERIATILIQQGVFAQAIEEYQKIIELRLDQDSFFLDELVNALAIIGKDNLSNTQIDTVLNTLNTQVSTVQAKSARSGMRIARSVNNGQEAFQIFKGMALTYDNQQDKMSLYSRSSLWYGLQSKDNFDQSGFLADLANTGMVKPKSGFISKEDLNIVQSSQAPIHGAVETEFSLASISSQLNNGQLTPTVLYRNHPEKLVDLPMIMNMLTVSQLIIKTATNLDLKLGDPEKVKNYFKKASDIYSAVNGFVEENKTKLQVVNAMIEIALKINELRCGTDDNCKNKYRNIIVAHETLSNLAATVFNDSNEEEKLKEELYADAVKNAMGALGQLMAIGFNNSVLGGSADLPPLQVSNFNLKCVLLGELIIRPLSQAAGQEISGFGAYLIALDVFNKKPAKLLELIKGENLEKTILNLSNLAVKTVDLFGNIKNFIENSAKLDAKTIVANVVMGSLENANAIVADAIINIAASVTPKKILDVALAANQGGALAYDWITDPSLVHMNMKKENNQLLVEHSIPDLKAIRYLNTPVENPKIIDSSLPNNKLMWATNQLAPWQARLLNKEQNYEINHESELYVNQDRVNKLCKDLTEPEKCILTQALGSQPEDNHFLVMSGFKGSVENQTAFNKNDEGTIEAMIDSSQISMLWHVRRFDSADKMEVIKVSERENNQNTFNNNYVSGKLENTLSWFNNAITTPHKKNPLHEAVLGNELKNKRVLDFTQFYKNETGDKTAFPLKHVTPGIYSDYTYIKFSKSALRDEELFENTLNFFVIPDLTAIQKTFKDGVAKAYQSNGYGELQIDWTPSVWQAEAPNGLWMVLRYRDPAKGGYYRWLTSTQLSSPAWGGH
ncbi:MAG: hypothetical protein Q8S52_01410, partial [Methylobacter sp.]|nr:hypothetical protein [Methylobacter sp.]